MMKLYIDGDGCNARARELALRLTTRGVFVTLVSNVPLVVPPAVLGNAHYCTVVVGREEDAVDSYVLHRIDAGDALITRDLLFAKQALIKGAWVASDYGERYFVETIDVRIISARSRMNIREHTCNANNGERGQSRNKKERLMHLRQQQLAVFLNEWIHYMSAL